MFINKLLVKGGVWKSGVLSPTKSAALLDQDVLVIMRWTANLRKVDANPASDDDSNNDPEVKKAKASDTYDLFRKKILTGERAITWTLTETTGDTTRVIPEEDYLTRGEIYEDDEEVEDEDGEIKMQDRRVPTGFYTALYRHAAKSDSTYTITLTQNQGKSFCIHKFHMDVCSMQPLPHNWEKVKGVISTVVV